MLTLCLFVQQPQPPESGHSEDAASPVVQRSVALWNDGDVDAVRDEGSIFPAPEHASTPLSMYRATFAIYLAKRIVIGKASAPPTGLEECQESASDESYLDYSILRPDQPVRDQHGDESETLIDSSEEEDNSDDEDDSSSSSEGDEDDEKGASYYYDELESEERDEDEDEDEEEPIRVRSRRSKRKKQSEVPAECIEDHPGEDHPGEEVTNPAGPSMPKIGKQGKVRLEKRASKGAPFLCFIIQYRPPNETRICSVSSRATAT